MEELSAKGRSSTGEVFSLTVGTEDEEGTSLTAGSIEGRRGNLEDLLKEKDW